MPDKTAKLTVVRDTAAVGGMCYMGFYINGILAARIDGGEKASFLVEPGEAILRLTWDPHAGPICNAKDRWIQRETQLRANEEKNFRLSVDPGGTLDVIRSDL